MGEKSASRAATLTDMSVIIEHVPFYRAMFAQPGFWREKFLFIGLPYIQGDRLPADFRYQNLLQLARAKKLKQVYSVDLFDANANYRWDLNRPVPVKYHETFKTVFDIGTLEHIFDTRQCLENYLRLVAVGGLFALVTPVNGYFAHGFHVFNPHAIIDTLEQNHFTIEYCTYSTSTGLEVADPSIRKNILLFIVARKKQKLRTFVVPQQRYWEELYAVKHDQYRDISWQPGPFNTALFYLKRAKYNLLTRLPISWRTWLLKRLN